MKIYTTQREIEADIKDGVLAIEGDVKFECSFAIKASIAVRGNITARDINALDLTAYDINAHNLTVFDIIARNINAFDISYNAFCDVYNSIKCESIKSRRTVHSKPVCLDGRLTITPKTSTKEMTVAEVSKELGYDVKIVK